MNVGGGDDVCLAGANCCTGNGGGGDVCDEGAGTLYISSGGGEVIPLGVKGGKLAGPDVGGGIIAAAGENRVVPPRYVGAACQSMFMSLNIFLYKQLTSAAVPVAQCTTE